MANVLGLDLSWHNILHSNALNVLLILTGLWLVLRKLDIPAQLDAQKEVIKAQIEEASLLRSQTDAVLQDALHKLNTLPEEAKIMLHDAQESATVLANRILGQAQEEAQRLVTAAQARLAQELLANKAWVQAHFLTQVLADAEAQLQAETDTTLQKRSVERFIQEL